MKLKVSFSIYIYCFAVFQQAPGNVRLASLQISRMRFPFSLSVSVLTTFVLLCHWCLHISFASDQKMEKKREAKKMYTFVHKSEALLHVIRSFGAVCFNRLSSVNELKRFTLLLHSFFGSA